MKNLKLRLTTLTIPLLTAALLAIPQSARAAEGASSYFFPGAAGSFAVALPPQPGLTVANQLFILSARASRAALNGRLVADLEVDAILNYTGLLYATKPVVAGGTFAAGAFVPFGRVGLEAAITLPNGNRLSADASDFNIGDMALVPASLYWSKGNVHVKVAEYIYAPTGHYNINNPISISRNYWGFDSQAALTYLNPKRGFEASAASGIMFNTTNTKTDYKTGNEFHTDFMVNQFLAKTFALGVQAYYYDQVSGDSGTGARLGEFQGKSAGWGPALFWSPKQTAGKLAITAKWMKDVHAVNRLRGSYAVVVVAFKL